MFSTLNIITDLSSGRRPDSIELTIVGVLNADRKFTDTRFLVTVISNTLNQSETTRVTSARLAFADRCVAPGWLLLSYSGAVCLLAGCF